ncbi:hypothetical protein [Haloarchaeobius sp. DFWS5]|uniref:hypothetical protein n=1 Tax=Haloarchaeobius sp. DFWS5 TaxID=3446114 RepID=UPI003EB9D805
MPGAGRSDSQTLQYVGLLVFAVALLGWVALGWDFQSSDGPIPLVIAAGCVVLAVGATVYRRFG